MAEPALQIETDDDWSMSDRRQRAVMQQSEAMSDPVDDRPFPTGRGKLTKAEIEALLRPDLPDVLPEEPAARPAAERELPSFSAPTPAIRETRDDEDSRAIAAAISLGLRQDCRLPAAARVASLTTGEFQEIFEGARRGGACLFFSGPRGGIVAALSLSPELTTSFIDLACGGEGISGGVSGRALTAIDAEMLTALLGPIAPSIGTDYTLARTEIDVRFSSAMTPPGAAELIDLTVTLGGMEAPARLGILHAESDVETAAAYDGEGADFATAVLTARIASLSVPVSRLSNLKPGATLMLGVPADQPVELLSGGRDGLLAAEGEIGRKGKAIAVRITRRGQYLRKAARAKAQQIR